MNSAKHGKPGAEAINGVVNSASLEAPKKAGDAALLATQLITEATLVAQSRRIDQPL